MSDNLFWFAIFLVATAFAYRFLLWLFGSKRQPPPPPPQFRSPWDQPISKQPSPQAGFPPLAIPSPPAAPAVRKPRSFPAQKWTGVPRRIAFFDVETTGLTTYDRIVSLGLVILETASLQVQTHHLIFNPQRLCSPGAVAAHGYDDVTLSRQELFATHAPELLVQFLAVDLIVAHNAAFDMRFIASAFRRMSFPKLNAPSFCTMLEYRRREGGSAALQAICERLNLPRARTHSALEDAWRTMQVYRWMNGQPYIDEMRTIDPSPSNFRP